MDGLDVEENHQTGSRGMSGDAVLAGSRGMSGDAVLTGSRGMSGDAVLAGSRGMSGDVVLTGSRGVSGDAGLTHTTAAPKTFSQVAKFLEGTTVAKEADVLICSATEKSE